MGFFSSLKDKLSSIVVGTAAGEWAVTAMAVMVFADGDAEPEELEKAKVVATTNPVVKNSIGSVRGAALFAETVDAIKVAPGAMLQTYLNKLDVLGRKIGTADDKNFALAAVIAVATADGDVERPEHDLLVRFKALIGATIDIPDTKA